MFDCRLRVSFHIVKLIIFDSSSESITKSIPRSAGRKFLFFELSKRRGVVQFFKLFYL